MSVDFGASVSALVQWGVLLLLVFFFISMTRRASNRQRQNTQAMLDGLQVGDEVVTSSGIYGSVAQLADTRIGLEIAPGIIIEVARQVVARKVDDAELGRASDAPVDEDDVNHESEAGNE
jgi:preprotein translocase subunit YajC